MATTRSWPTTHERLPPWCCSTTVWGYRGFEPQHEAMSAFARDHELPIASLPTGQGLLLKP